MKTQLCEMKIQLSEVHWGDRSFLVALLHQTMAVLGFPASPQEVKENHAGDSTGEQFKKLKKHFSVPEAIRPPVSHTNVPEAIRPPDSQAQAIILVSRADAIAIAKILKNECLSDASHLFDLAGTLKLKRGVTRKNRFVLLAFDLNVRGLAAYRRIEKAAEMIGNDGFEFLGYAVPDSYGRYGIFFYDWQYLRKQRKADIVVFAVAESGVIVGFSRLVHTDDYLDVRQVSDLDVLVGDEDEQTEYTTLVKELEQFLHGNETSWLGIAGSSEHLAYAAREMEIPLSQLNIAATVERLLFHKTTTARTREWMYGLGRQDIQLTWEALYKKTKDELYTAIAQSVAEKIIDAFGEAEQTEILKLVRKYSRMHLLEPPSGHVEDNSLNAMLTHALPQIRDREVFVDALGSFEGANYSEFWRTHLPAHPGFQDNPTVISKLLLTQQYTLLTGNHQKLVTAFHAKASSIKQLVALEAGDWFTMIKDAGVPDFVEGSTEEEKIERYAGQMQELVNVAFPTLRVANMIEKKELPIKKDSVSNGIRMFLADNPDFDISRSRIDNFERAIGAVAGNDSAEVKSELQTIQRLFQCCTSPKTLSVLKEHNLHSAFAIANIPRKVFVETHAKALGGELVANAIHQRADNIRIKNEMVAVHLRDISHGLVPQLAMDDVERNAAVQVIQKQIPNYTELFGSPDICECAHCHSVYSPAAYFVDVLRFLEKSALKKSAPNSSKKTPYDVLVGTPVPNSNPKLPDNFIGGRRPDLAQLKLSCENTNTIIPYIDLVNEVMEFYTANNALDNNALDGFSGHDTGDASPEELRANPQNVNVEAYRVLKDTKFPFTLPYHQPLDAIRTYGNHLGVSRYQVLKAINPQPDTVTTQAIAAESLSLSEEEYKILTKRDFRDEKDSTPLHKYFGYSDATRFSFMQNEKDADGNPRGVRPLLERSGLSYKELVEIVKTRFINPSLGFFEVIEEIFSLAAKSTGSSDGSTYYNLLEHVAAGSESRAEDAAIIEALEDYYKAKGFPPDNSNKPLVKFKEWVVANFAGFQQVMTLFEPLSRCDLDTTQLMTLQKIYEDTGEPTEYDTESGISFDAWSKLHRFVRLWRKLGWSIQQTDLILRALDQTDITPDTIRHLEVVSALTEATRQPLDHLAVLWGNIGSEGEKSLYKKLFLNKAVQEIDADFKVDAQGNYPSKSSAVLAEHQPAILAAFGIKENELMAILKVAKVIQGEPRLINMSEDTLSLPNLSTLYRHVILAKGLKMRITDLCTLIDIFNAQPFSIWSIDEEAFTHISPEKTYQFYELAASTRQAGFKPWELDYILRGNLPADSKQGLDTNKIQATVKVIRDAFNVIEQEYPAAHVEPTPEAITATLSLIFQPEIVSRLLSIVTGTATFDIEIPANLEITIPEDLADKYTYIKSTGLLSCIGVMTDNERIKMKALISTNDEFQSAVEALYLAPDIFIRQHFDDVFSDLAQASALLVVRSNQVPTDNLAQQLNYIYEHFLSLIKRKLQQDVITEKISTLIGLDEAVTARLIANDLDQLIAELSVEGFTATYFNDINWGSEAFQTSDNTINFDWGAKSPVSADNFSVRWQGHIAVPVTGQYTLVVEVEGNDDVFNLYLDGALILKKTTGDNTLSWETPKELELDAAQMHLLRLEYAETSNNAGIRLYWKTATTARNILPASAAYPTAVLEKFTEEAIQLHRAAKFISGFNMSETELDHFIGHAADFDHINFKALDINHWQRIRDYSNLRDAVPQAQALLTDVFALIYTQDPQPTVEMLAEKLAQATAWQLADVVFLVTSPTSSNLNMGIDDFKNEIALNRIRQVIQIVTKTGISANTIAKWGTVETDLTDFDAFHDTAQQLKNTVKAKYEDNDWLDIAANLSNTIRENQKQALISHLLTLPAIKAWGARDADGLFEYLLIDVQMGACMDTSRIVQATATVQMFINRCLLNLENEVSPKAIDKDRWEWMKNYRVWEANRKVFLYPENWLEPEWRNDRSEFFKELESHLVQNDITERSVEQGLRNYLTSLNEVANLEICGMHREDKDNGDLNLHVFGRTHNLPFKYFYRRWDEKKIWSAWEKVQVDIRSVEDGGDSGVHLIPVVWKKRLFLFWPEFMEAIQASEASQTKTHQQMGGLTASELNPKKYWEIRLAWSEYVDGKWSSKQVTKEYVSTEQFLDLTELKSFHFTPKVLPITQDLSIQIIYESRYGPEFIISDIQSPIKILNPLVWFDLSLIFPGLFPKPLYENLFSSRTSRAGQSKLELLDNVYLKTETNHKLLPDDGFSGLDLSLRNPFFFSDERRTYFVSTSDITVWEFKYPEFFPPIGPVEEVMYTFNPQNNNPGFSPGNIRPVVISSGAADTSVSKMVDTRSPFSAPQAKWSGFFSTRTRTTKGLAFHTFYHPFSSQYMTNLNQHGVPGLMASDTSIAPDDDGDTLGATFVRNYDPNFHQNRVKKTSGNRTDYRENICFDTYGANSLYNWELFFHAPLYIATRLSKNGKYEQAAQWFHYIFDPTTDATPVTGESEISRYWKVLPFKTEQAQKNLEELFRELNNETADPSNSGDDQESEFFKIVSDWRDNPFDPHLIASKRPLAYMKNVVIKYVENLIAWGDSLFRRFTRESVNEAIQIYVIANHILGPRPEMVPKRGKIASESYASLRDKLDDFGNALVALENIFPYSSAVNSSNISTGGSLLGVGSALYFCFPANDKLLHYWDTVADRLFKIRHCQDIDGVERNLALFSPPIDPGALIQAKSQGLGLGGILADLSSPPPIYRFSYLIQKANEFCGDVKALGSALLSTLEKRDGEELSRLRASHETTMVELVTAIRERQVLAARANKENLLKVRETAKFRLQHYKDLLGDDSSEPLDAPSLDATLTVNSQLPDDTSIPLIETEVDMSLVDSDESGVKLISREKDELEQSADASFWQHKANWAEMAANSAYFIPDFIATTAPLGNGFQVEFGGKHIGPAFSATAKAFNAIASSNLNDAQRAGKLAAYTRRTNEFILQANLAAREIIQLDKQITSADIQIQVAEKELQNHKQQIENTKEVELFLKDKFTNQELYQWILEQLFSVYKQSYNLAYEMAKKAEKAYQYELGTETTNFVQYGYWDSSKEGLVAGEKLQLALRQLDKSYLEENRRELELTKNISLILLNPLALIELRETGKCHVSLPEELFDLDFQGHYFRRIKSVSLSIPCVTGPYTTVNCTLRLIKNTMRINTKLNNENEDDPYEYANGEDPRFRSNHVPVTSIATSSGQNDAGMFEFNFRDERYLPFERAGAISDWMIELSTEKELRQFDYSTISDVILHLKYTARESKGLFKDKATKHVKNFIKKTAEHADQPFMRMFSMKQEFPTEWHKFFHPESEGTEQILKFTIGREKFPFFVQDSKVNVNKIDVFAKFTQTDNQTDKHQIILSYSNHNGEVFTSPEPPSDKVIKLFPKKNFGGLYGVSINVNDDEEPDINREIRIKLLDASADEIKDLFFVLHYQLGDQE